MFVRLSTIVLPFITDSSESAWSNCMTRIVFPLFLYQPYGRRFSVSWVHRSLGQHSSENGYPEDRFVSKVCKFSLSLISNFKRRIEHSHCQLLLAIEITKNSTESYLHCDVADFVLPSSSIDAIVHTQGSDGFSWSSSCRIVTEVGRPVTRLNECHAFLLSIRTLSSQHLHSITH